VAVVGDASSGGVLVENSCVLGKDSLKDLNLARICFMDYSCLFLSEI
jgi:hypothetical protein